MLTLRSAHSEQHALLQTVERVAAGLAACGLAEGSHIAILATNAKVLAQQPATCGSV